MARRALEQVQGVVEDLLEKTKGRRVSVLPSTASEDVQDAREPSQIKSKTQLEHWAQTNPSAVLIYLTEMRDMTLQCIESWEQMKASVEKAYDTALKTQHTNNQAKNDIVALMEQAVTLQGTVNDMEDAARLQQEEIDRLQNSLATAETDVLRARQELRASPSPSTTTGKRTAKFPDPPLFIGTNDPPFEDWVLELHDKLYLNADHFETNMAKAAYAIGRTSGAAAEHLNAYRVTESTYFKTQEMAIEVLQAVYQDPNRIRNARQSLARSVRIPCAWDAFCVMMTPC